MLKRVLLTLAAATATISIVGCASTPMDEARSEGWNHYGEQVSSGRAASLGALEGGDRDIIIEGAIQEVCPKKGCWMHVVDDEGTIRTVRFEDYSFFVPRNAAGRRVVVHGRAETHVASVDELRHYAEDAGKSPEEIAAITKPREQIIVYADSVYIEGEGLDEPHEE